jgi:hypothetical protein
LAAVAPRSLESAGVVETSSWRRSGCYCPSLANRRGDVARRGAHGKERPWQQVRGDRRVGSFDLGDARLAGLQPAGEFSLRQSLRHRAVPLRRDPIGLARVLSLNGRGYQIGGLRRGAAASPAAWATTVTPPAASVSDPTPHTSQTPLCEPVQEQDRRGHTSCPISEPRHPAAGSSSKRWTSGQAPCG